MTTEVKTITQTKKNRVSLCPEAAQLLGSWLKEIGGGNVKLNRSDLVNWLILNRDQVLSQKELNQIRKQYFDQLSALTSALKEVKRAQKLGATSLPPSALEVLKEVVSQAPKDTSRAALSQVEKRKANEENIEKVTTKSSNS